MGDLTTTIATPQASGDAFHVLRDCRALYLTLLEQALLEVDNLPPNAVKAFLQAVGTYYDEMTATRRRSGFEVAKGLTSSRITLVDESDLELEIRLGDFSAHLMESTGGDLWRVYLRFMTLLNRPDLSTADNPVGPRGISQGIVELCARMGEDQEKTLARVDRLENGFTRSLTGLYAALNDFLAERHVAPAQPAIVTSPEATTPTPGSLAGSAPTPATNLQSRLLGPATATPEKLAPAAFEALFARLDDLARSGKLTLPPVHSSTATSPSLEMLIPGLFDAADSASAQPASLSSSELGIPGGTTAAAGIDSIALIFRAILEMPELPEAIKTILFSLQIPLLKLALLDSRFFTAKAHPGHLLVDRIARAALGLPSDTPSGNPLCASIDNIAAGIRNKSASDIKVFEKAIGELNTLITERDSQVSRSAAAYLPLLHQVDRRKHAQQRCRDVIEQQLSPNVPAVIATFLRTHWQKVLLVSWMENGEQSTLWQDNTALVKDLLWSIEPKTEIDDRKHLAKMLPAVVRRLNAGMARIGLDEASQSSFLDACFALQTTAMRGATAPEAASPTTYAIAAAKSLAISELSTDKLLLKIYDLGTDATLPGHSTALPPPVGTWLRLTEIDEQPLCGLLCQISPDSGLLLIANPDWDFALAMHPDVLEQKLKAGSAHNCMHDSLFDKAAEQALHSPAAL